LTLADECWTNDIADYAPQEDDYRRRAELMLTAWWERDGQDLINTDRALFTEYKFQITVGDHIVKGFIDRIDRALDAEGNTALSIVDYKTGSKAKTKADTNEDLQLAVYHLAATRDPLLNEHGDVVALQLDFLAEDRQVDQFITPQHALLTEARINAVADRMLTEETEPSVEASCEFCDLKRLCDLQPAGRPVPVRLQGSS
jgi:RecB family exonuclease